jgi:acetyl-CoA carboxylase biotin carboxyl carrier protein
MIDLRYVKKLIEMLDESNVDSIEISTDKGIKIRLSKSPSSRGTVAVAAPIPMAVGSPEMTRTTPTGGMPVVPEAAPAAPPVAAGPKLLEVKSPMVGTFYASPEPGAKAYVGVGDRIKKGQVVCIIEAMKIMNEIESECDGVVREVLVDNAHPVEYGQVLFRVAPNG